MSELKQKGGIPPKKLYTFYLRQQQQMELGGEGLSDAVDSKVSSSSLKDSGIESTSSSDGDILQDNFTPPSNVSQSTLGGKVMPPDMDFNNYSDPNFEMRDDTEIRNRSYSINIPAQRSGRINSYRGYVHTSAPHHHIQPPLPQNHVLEDDFDLTFPIKRSSNSFSGVRTQRYSSARTTPPGTPYTTPTSSELFLDSDQHVIRHRRMSNDMLPRHRHAYDRNHMSPDSTKSSHTTGNTIRDI